MNQEEEEEEEEENNCGEVTVWHPDPYTSPSCKEDMLTTYSFFPANLTLNLTFVVVVFICTRFKNCLQRGLSEGKKQHSVVRRRIRAQDCSGRPHPGTVPLVWDEPKDQERRFAPLS